MAFPLLADQCSDSAFENDSWHPEVSSASGRALIYNCARLLHEASFFCSTVVYVLAEVIAILLAQAHRCT